MPIALVQLALLPAKQAGGVSCPFGSTCLDIPDQYTQQKVVWNNVAIRGGEKDMKYKVCYSPEKSEYFIVFRSMSYLID